MKPKRWLESTDVELSEGVQSLKRELFVLRNEYKFARKVEKPHKLRAIRRDIARALTESSARKGISIQKLGE